MAHQTGGRGFQRGALGIGGELGLGGEVVTGVKDAGEGASGEQADAAEARERRVAVLGERFDPSVQLRDLLHG